MESIHSSLITNFTSNIQLVKEWDESDHLAQLLLAITSIGVTVSPECWLTFPLLCIGCNLNQFNRVTQNAQYEKTVNLLTSLCQLVTGQLPSDLDIGMNEWPLLQRLRSSAQYEPDLRPNLPVKPELVNVTIQVVSVENLDLSQSSFKLDILLHQEWNDHRLKHHYPGLLDGAKLGIGVWIPDTYFVQARRGTFSRIAHEGKTIKVKGNGDVSSGARVHLEVKCPINLRNFPMDIQVCTLDLESYGYTMEELLYNWSKHEVIMKKEEEATKSLSQYTLKPVKISKGTNEYVLGHWSKLQVEFSFVRNSIIFILYFPCAMVVFISWITFMLEIVQYPARTYLCVTSLLTIVTLQTAMNASLPKVSYVKAIDKYIVACILFVAGAFIEYAIVLMISIKKTSLHRNNSSFNSNKYDKVFNGSAYTIQSNCSDKSFRKKKLRRRNSMWRSQSTHPNVSLTDNDDQQIVLTKYGAVFQFYLSDSWPKKLDKFSRVFFPSVFVVFNLVYWITYQ